MEKLSSQYSVSMGDELVARTDLSSLQELFLDDSLSCMDKTLTDEPIYSKKSKLLPDDIAYVMDKINNLTTEEAQEIGHQIIIEHQYDLNFDKDTMSRLKDLVKGPAFNQMPIDEYEFELKSETAVIKYFSPYPEVRAVTEPYDDPTVPVETIRAHILGYIWAVIGQFINSFFQSRFPNITITSTVCQVFLYPCGMFAAWALPDWGLTIKGTRHTLNPGPWSYKEQMFSTIVFDVAMDSVYVFYNIQTQEVLYNDTWLDAAYKILLILSTQLMGLGFAGLLRRFVVYPVETFWPTILPTLALNRTLLVPERKETVHGWSISKYRFFFICFTAMFVYYWIPGYLFRGLSYFSWMSWIAPDNFNLAVITGTQNGLGYNPLPTFDWNLIGFNSPLSTPFFSFSQQYAGTFISGLIILGMYFRNSYNTGYFPINSSGLYTNTGKEYDVFQVMTNGTLDEKKYSNYSPPFYSSGSILAYGAFFVCYPVTFVYIVLDKWRLLQRSYKMILKTSLLYIKRSYVHTKRASIHLLKGNIIGFFKELSKITYDDSSIYEGFDDPFTRMISRYPEVPDWWFLSIVFISFSFAIVLLTGYPDLNTPVWTIFFVIGINLVFLVPIALMSATTGTSIGLNVLVEMIMGYAIPGNAESMMFVKAYGYNLGSMADTYISDQKMAHYSKIPPRAVYRGQIIATFIAAFVAYGVVNFVDNNVEGICTATQKESFTCAYGSRVYFSASVVWGLIGPERIFSQQYPVLKWMFLFGFVVAVVWWLVRNFGPEFRRWCESNLNSKLFKVLNVSIFTPISWLYPIHPALVCFGALSWSPVNISYTTVGLYFSFGFMWYLKKYKTGWWQKYNYVLDSALSGAMAFSAVIIFFAVQYHPKSVNWWGNKIVNSGIDGGYGRTAYKTELPAKGYFGPDEWH